MNPILQQVIVVGILAILTVVIDGSFIQGIMKPHWETTVQTIQKSPLQIRLHYAILAYIILVVGIYVFVWRPIYGSSLPTSLDTIPWKQVIGLSMAWGLVTYGIYDFTTGAILSDYPNWLLATDVAWGMTMTTLVVVIASVGMTFIQ